MSELRTNRIIPRNGLPSGASGGIIQVVSTTKTDTFTLNSEDPTAVTGLTATITPTRSDSKILIYMDVNSSASAGNYTSWWYIYRDNSVVSGARGDQGESSQDRAFKAVRHKESNWPTCASGMFLDSPSETAATTYQIYMSQEGGSTGYLNRTHSNNNNAYHPRNTSSITVMEITG